MHQQFMSQSANVEGWVGYNLCKLKKKYMMTFMTSKGSINSKLVTLYYQMKMTKKIPLIYIHIS